MRIRHNCFLVYGSFVITTWPLIVVPCAETLNCPTNYYFDHGSRHCENCREICDHSEIKRTTDQCLSDCPDYNITAGCKENEYYDPVVQSCSPCSELCHQHKKTENTDECLQKCKVYLDKKDVDDLLLGTASTPGWLWWQYILIALAATATVALVVVAALLMVKKRRHDYIHPTEQRLDLKKVNSDHEANFGLQETTPGVRSAPAYISAPLTGPGILETLYLVQESDCTN